MVARIKCNDHVHTVPMCAHLSCNTLDVEFARPGVPFSREAQRSGTCQRRLVYAETKSQAC
eukprot:6456775-Amphidinium_carterae.1